MEQNPTQATSPAEQTETAENPLNIDKNHKFNFEFNLDEIYILGVGLGKLPYETVKPIINYIQTDLTRQIEIYVASQQK